MTLQSGRVANGEVCVIKNENLPQIDYTASSLMETNIGGIFFVFLGLFFTGFGQTVYFALSHTNSTKIASRRVFLQLNSTDFFAITRAQKGATSIHSEDAIIRLIRACKASRPRKS